MIELGEFQEAVDEYSVSEAEFVSFANRAITRGCVIHVSDDTHLLLDFDEPFVQGKVYGNDAVWGHIEDYIGIKSVRYYASEHKNTHCIVTLGQPVPIAVRLALQAALGSDPIRASLEAIRLLRDVSPEPSRLFEPPQGT